MDGFKLPLLANEDIGLGITNQSSHQEAEEMTFKNLVLIIL